ncbi:MAG: hypothetical protein KA397_04550 [Paludibacteraceae bacterium]|nr:hypothetical protein [Paludibacteraceae bacterium]MBP6284525.1 hypothetical protein [Paludibacteraceae bacterium]
MKKLILFLFLSFSVANVYAIEKRAMNTVQEEVVSVVGDKLYVTAKAGEEVNLFALTGQNLFRAISEGGVMVVEDLPSNQILVVRIANKAYKVKL